MADDDLEWAALHARVDQLLWWAETNRAVSVAICRQARAARLASERVREGRRGPVTRGRPDRSSPRT